MQYVYALHTGSKDYFYCGRTDDVARRLAEHIRSANANGTVKERVIYKLLQEGVPIEIEVLESGEDLRGREDIWITNLMGKGMSLANSRAGDDARNYKVTASFPYVPWSASLFEHAEWSKGVCPGEKSNEKSAWIKGVLFHRVGKSKLRVNHPEYGSWDCGGYLWDDKVKAAVAMLTVGTVENGEWMRQVKQRDNLKPSKSK